MVVYCMQDRSRYFREGENAESNIDGIGMHDAAQYTNTILSLL